MNQRVAIALFVVMVAAIPTSLAAQDRPASPWSYTVEPFFNVGNGRLYLGDSLWGSGADWAVGAEVRPLSGWADRLGFEIPVAQLEESGGSPDNQVLNA